jgi:hypothetical protein
MKEVDLESVTTRKVIVRIHQNLQAKKSDYSLAVNPVTITKKVLSAMKKADRFLSIEPKPGSAHTTILDPAKLPTDEKTFGDFCEVYDERRVRGPRRLVIAVALNLTRRLHEIKGDYAAGLMPFLQENKVYINESLLGYEKQTHIGHFFGLPPAIWRPAQVQRTRIIMAKTMTKAQVVTFLQAEGVNQLPKDDDGNETTVPKLVLEVDTPGAGRGDSRVETTALRIKVTAKYARLALHQLTLATANESLCQEFGGADYLPPGMHEAITDYRSFILGHNQFLEEHTLMRVNGLTIDALNMQFNRTDDGPADLPLHQIFTDAGVSRIEETSRTDKDGSWLFILPKTKVPTIRSLLDHKIPKLYQNHVPNDPQYRIPGIPYPFRAKATLLHGGGDTGSIASGISGISNVSEGFTSIAARYQSKALHYATNSKSKSVTTPSRVGRPRNITRNKPVSLVYGDLDSTEFPALPSKRTKVNNTNQAQSSYVTAVTADMTSNTPAPNADQSTIATNPTNATPMFTNEAFEAQLLARIATETEAKIANSISAAIVPVNIQITKLQTEIESLKVTLMQIASQLLPASYQSTPPQMQDTVPANQRVNSDPAPQHPKQAPPNSNQLQSQNEWTDVTHSKRKKSPPTSNADVSMDSDHLSLDSNDPP